MTTTLTRRCFIRKAALISAAVALPLYVPREVFAKAGRPGANDRLGIAVIGAGRQGEPVTLGALKDKRTTAVAVCDVWEKRAQTVAAKMKAPFVCQDYQRVIDRNDVDAILTATPEHWRSLICVNAALAGKHLYVEKPITLTIADGIAIRKAARKTGIKFQCGSMQRSDRENYLGCLFIREGGLGKILHVESANYESPWRCNLPAEPVPTGLDWNTWCGPVEPIPFHSELFIPRGKPGWLSFIPFSGGEMTGWGTHGFDQIQCALDTNETAPVEILVEGDALIPPTYNEPESNVRGNQLCSTPRLAFRYASGITVTLGNGNRGGAIFTGEKGKLEIFRSKLASNPSELIQAFRDKHKEFQLPSHQTDWINAIYNDTPLIGEMETGIRTAEICHLLNIARYLGRSLRWDPAKEEFLSDSEATTMLSRQHRKGFELPA